MATLGKIQNLLLGLHDAELSRRKQTAANKLQSVVFLLFLHRQYTANKLLNLLHKTYEQQRVDDVEGGVEG